MNPKSLPPDKYRWIDKGIFARGTTKGIRYGISYNLKGWRVRETGDTLGRSLDHSPIKRNHPSDRLEQSI